MQILLWFFVLQIVAAAGWLLAAFVFRGGHTARLVATLMPAWVVGAAWIGLLYLPTRSATTDVGWDILFAILAATVGAIAAVLCLPCWYMFEERLGWRAPNA